MGWMDDDYLIIYITSRFTLFVVGRAFLVEGGGGGGCRDYWGDRADGWKGVLKRLKVGFYYEELLYKKN